MNDIGTLEKTIREKAVSELKSEMAKKWMEVRNFLHSKNKSLSTELKFSSDAPTVYVVIERLFETDAAQERATGDEAVQDFIQSRAKLEVDVMELKQRIEELKGVGAA